jgi:hypothetical protein
MKENQIQILMLERIGCVGFQVMGKCLLFLGEVIIYPLFWLMMKINANETVNTKKYLIYLYSLMESLTQLE